MKIRIALAALALIASAPLAHAEDVHVRGYTRSDGTYVQPHIRSAPNSSRADNYGPSSSSNSYGSSYSGLYSAPSTRDHDRDGTPNYRDRDDDNDVIHDNSDRSQYGRVGGSAWGN